MELQLDNLRISPPTFQAPMEAITDRPFRALIRELGGCGLTCTEFVSSKMMSRQLRRAWRNAAIGSEERPIAIQIYGRDPEEMARSAQICEGLGAQVIDLNLGCPSKQVTRGEAGAALMRTPSRAQTIFAAVKAAVQIPMTVKMRLGWDEEQLNAPEIAYIAQEEGAAAVTVHARTRVQMYQGRARWEEVAAVSARLSIPLIINGEILYVEDALQAMNCSGAQGVMVGRGLLRDPWILKQIAARLSGERFQEPGVEARAAFLTRYLDLLEESSKTPRIALGRIKKATGYFTREIPGGEELRRSIYHSQELSAVRDHLQLYFQSVNRS